MKNKLILLIFIFFFNCSGNKDLNLDIEELKKQGNIILTNKSKDDPNQILENINSIELYQPVSNIINWKYPNYNYFNLVPHVNFNFNSILNKKKIVEIQKLNNFNKRFVYNNEHIIFVDDKSNLKIYDKNLKLANKFLIYESKEIKDYQLKFELIIENNILFVSDNLGTILSYDLVNYKLLWKNNFSVPFLSNLIIFKESIFVTNSNGKLYSFNINTGELRWSYDTGTNMIQSYDAYKLVRSDDKIIFANNTSTINCIDLDKKKIIWDYKLEYSTSLNVNSNIFKISDLIVEKNFLYFSSNLGFFYKFNVDTGKILWQKKISSSSRSLINPKTIFIIDDNKNLIILDKNNGNILYKKNLIEIFYKKKVILKKNDELFFFLGNHKLYILNNNEDVFSFYASDLNQIDYKKISGKIKSNLIFINNHLFFIDKSGYLINY